MKKIFEKSVCFIIAAAFIVITVLSAAASEDIDQNRSQMIEYTEEGAIAENGEITETAEAVDEAGVLPAEEPRAAEAPQVIEEPQVIEGPQAAEEPQAAEGPQVIEEPQAAEGPQAAEESQTIEETAAAQEAIDDEDMLSVSETGSEEIFDEELSEEEEDAALELSAAYTTINGKSIPVSQYPLGAAQTNCWEFANNVYAVLWGTGYNAVRNADDNLLRNINTLSDLTITAAHTKEYISQAALGAVIRVCDDPLRDDDYAINYMHSMILVGKSSTGLTVYHGNWNWNNEGAKVHITTFTWDEFANQFKNYKYFKYIKWPGAEQARVYPATVTLGKAAICDTGVKVSWSAAKNADSYNVYRKLSTDSSWTLLKAHTKGTSFTDTTCVSGKTYVYTVRGYNSEFKTLSQSFDKTGLSFTFLSSPQNLKVAYTASGVTVKWSAVTGANKYYIYRKPASGGSYTQLGISTTTSYTDTAMSPGTEYYYTVRAYNNASKLKSWYISPGVWAYFVKAPAVKSASVTTGIKLTWGSIDQAESYRIYRKTASGKYTVIQDNYTGTSYIDKTATAGTLYYYAVKAYDSSQDMFSSFTAASGVWMKAPTVKVAASSGKVVVAWTRAAGAQGYKVFRKVSGGSWKLIKTITSGTTLKYTDTTAVKGTTYYYTVRPYTKITGSLIYGLYNTAGVSVKAK